MKDKIAKIINKAFGILGIQIVKINGLNRLKEENGLLHELVQSYINYNKTNSKKNSCECVIFSMDRALQLHSLLSSFYEKVDEDIPIHILYRSTSETHEQAYRKVFEIFKDRKITVVKQENKESFKPLLISIVEKIQSQKFFFLVDDIVFVEDVKIKDIISFDTRDYIFSLRLSKTLDYSYTDQKDMPLPEFTDSTEDKLFWKWNHYPIGTSDWSYPLSVDGHVFSTQEFLAILRYTDFNSPNTLEANLYRHVHYFANRFGVCYKKQKLINLTINKVQNDSNNNNIAGNIHQDYLLQKWNEGYQMDYQKFYGGTYNSTHLDIPIEFKKR